MEFRPESNNTMDQTVSARGRGPEGLLDYIASRHEILNVLARHNRGIDRNDADLMKSAYHADATVAYGVFTGGAHEFCDFLVGSDRDGPVSMHRHNNRWIDIRGETAVSESYVIAYSQREQDGNPVQAMIGGRYLDTHARRDGVWKMTNRTFVLEWNTNRPGTGTALPTFDPGALHIGTRGQADASARVIEPFYGHRASVRPQETTMPSVAIDLAVRAEQACSRFEIHDLIMAHCRAIDRIDADLLKTIWHEEATLDVGSYQGNALEFFVPFLDVIKQRKTIFHSIANEWIEIDGDSAVGESYVIAFSTHEEAAGDFDEFTGGRYVDVFRRFDGLWKIAHRTFVQDWKTREPSTDQSEEGMYAQLRLRGGRFPDDPVYSLWNQS
jgi:hypothetical protein